MIRNIASTALVFLGLTPALVAEPAAPDPAARTLYVHVEGMKSDVCETHLEDTLMADIERITDARADHQTGWVWIEIEATEDSEEAIREAIEKTCSFKVTEVRREPPGGRTER